ncbi:MAG: hypothetical protein ABL909_09525 [Sphingopyxis sp.]
MRNLPASLERLTDAVDRMERAIAAVPRDRRPLADVQSSRDSLRAEVAEAIAELDRLIGQNNG